MIAGGYSRRSKRYRTAVRGRMFNIATDFGPRNRDWWEGNGITVPAAKLYIDRHRLSVPTEFYEGLVASMSYGALLAQSAYAGQFAANKNQAKVLKDDCDSSVSASG